ncbi:hypothetical protein [Pseudomonas fluorescens]|uniref:Uncharacterized protein n=1 Tax=Pseudomonas fluorescens TaxID=294 RepID=A0A0D0P6P2_PSEFL|nr:hypothetical protein [Pseudomonas fluorescens]KIQ56457.1 hypothetical protein RL74_25950 [Pseudomonas fluorescens]
MSEVKRYGHIGYLVDAAPQMLQMYPGMTVYVLAEDFDRITAENTALQQRLTTADQRIDELEGKLAAIASWTTETRGAVLEAFQDELNESASYPWYDAAIADLMKLIKALSASAEPADEDWHMNPCKQGHGDVGAAGGVAHCYACDEKIEAATTQEAFEQWNATHPATAPAKS